MRDIPRAEFFWNRRKEKEGKTVHVGTRFIYTIIECTKNKATQYKNY